MKPRSNQPVKFPAPLLVSWRGEKIACCERHAHAIINMNALMGKFTDVTHALYEDDAECGDCLKEEEKRIEAEKQRKQEAEPTKKGKRHDR